MSRLFLLLISILLGMFSSFAQPQKLVLATYAYADNNRLKNITPLADYLAAQLGRSVETKSYPTVHAFIAAIQAGAVDIALINTFGYLLLATDKNNPMMPLLAMRVDPSARDNYKTVIVARPSVAVSGAQDFLKNAKNYSFLFVAEGSTSGNLVPRMYLSSLGIKNPETAFKKVDYGGNHAATLAKVLEGTADMGAFGSEEYYKMLSRDPSAANQVKVFWLSEEITLGPVLVKKDMPQALRDRLEKEFLSLHSTRPEAFTAVKAGWSESKQAVQYVSVTDRYYETFRNLTGNRADLISILNQFTR